MPRGRPVQSKPTHRTCRHCAETKPTSEFYASQGNTCKRCHNARKNERAWARGRPKRCGPEQARENELAAARQYKKDNPHTNAAFVNNRRAAKSNRMPDYIRAEVTAAHAALRQQSFELQDIFGEPFEVDHVVPLFSEFVSGLHVPWNLQLLPATVNRRKGSTHSGPEAWCLTEADQEELRANAKAAGLERVGTNRPYWR
jgi:hypothetical protein